jgi:predicted DNA repair protein MutK
MTVGVYGLVAGIVKLDDAGLYLTQRGGRSVLASLVRGLGAGIIAFAPWLMKFLSVAGTAAMFLVGGGILAHGVPLVDHWIKRIAGSSTGLYTMEAVAAAIIPSVGSLIVGLVAGALAVLVVEIATKIWRKSNSRRVAE